MSIKANDDVGHDNDSESYLPSGYRSMDPYLRDSYMGAIQGDHMMEKSSSSSEDEIQINTANVVIIKREDERQQSTYLDPSEYTFPAPYLLICMMMPIYDHFIFQCDTFFKIF